MFRNALAVFLSVLLVLPVQGYQQEPAAVQEQVGKIAKGSMVEVRTKLKERKRITGRLGEVTAEGLEVQVTQGKKTDSVKVRYADVNSIQEKRPMKLANQAVSWGVLVGIAVGVSALIAAATGLDRK